MTHDNRRALRVAINVPTVVQPIGQPPVDLHENLQKVYERVQPADVKIGEKLPGVLRDLSTNGAFIAGEPLPLLSRVAFAFELTGFGTVEVIGWALWRRSEDCALPRDDGNDTILPSGFGVLFEAIPLDARVAIHRLVVERSPRN
jgi:hypothetical protein